MFELLPPFDIQRSEYLSPPPPPPPLLYCAHLSSKQKKAVSMPGRRCLKRVYKQTSLQNQIKEAKGDQYCDHCIDGPLPSKHHLQFDRNLWRIFVAGEDKTGCNVKKQLTTKKIIDILTNISDEDCRHLGFDPSSVRPEWMVLTVLPIPPPNMRPYRKDRQVF